MPFQQTIPDDPNPDINAQHATTALEPTRFGPVRWVAETGSTNDDLMSEATSGARDGRVLVADHQTAGRGRRDRTWASAPRSALQTSILLRPDIDPSGIAILTAALGAAAAKACEDLGCRGVRIKWPNDLVVGPVGERRKLAGMLSQVSVVGSEVVVVAGLGLNVHSVASLPDGAVSLDELGSPPSRVDLLVAVLEGLERRLTQLESGPETLWAEYRGLSATLGTTVRARLDGLVIEGHAVDISDVGGLVIDEGGGRTTEDYLHLARIVV